jgi:flagellar secretion chaperone FliS
MANPRYEHYLQIEILNADPVKLVSILYRAAIEALGAARRHLQLGAIRERSLQITKASAIINELMLSLNHQQGGEISRTLGGLYAYMQSRLIEANSRQIEEPLAEVQNLLATLLEAWSVIPSVASRWLALPEQVAENEEYVRRALG